MSNSFLLSLGIIIIGYIGIRSFRHFIYKIAQKKEVTEKRLFYIKKIFDLLFVLILLVSMGFVWSVDFKALALVASSIFAIIGVALFAQWSILSNITASIIIFFTFPAKVGDTIKIIDGDNSVQGIIKEIALFHIEIIDDGNNSIIYPNSLLLQKPVVKITQ